MSNAVFPSLAGLTWDVVKAPLWNTGVQQSVGGKEIRAQYFSAPLYRWQMKYELLRAGLINGQAFTELQSLIGFFNARQGKFDSFLFSDPSDNTVTLHGFGVGDGTTTTFPLRRTLAGPRQVDAINGLCPVATLPRINRVLYSQDLTNAAWSKVGTATAVSFPTVAPDGSLSVSRISVNGPSNVIVQSCTGFTAGASLVTSFWVRLVSAGTSGTLEVANASAGDFAGFTATTSWQRVQVQTAALGNGTAGIQFRSNGTAGVPWVLDIWGCQQEEGTAATPYIATTGSAVQVNPTYSPPAVDGFEPTPDLNGAPVIYTNDYGWRGLTQLSPVSRVNRLLYSQDLSNAQWVKTGTAADNGLVTAPDGTFTAHRITVNGAANAFTNTVTGFAPYARVRTSFWVRANTTGSGVLTIANAINGAETFTVTPSSTWQRVSGMLTANSAGTAGLIIESSVAGTAWIVDVWGFQQEDGTLLGSYIPTTSGAVTLAAEYTLSAGVVTFTTAPASGVALAWTGSYYWRARFDQDQAELTNFLYQLWEMKQLTLVSVKT